MILQMYNLSVGASTVLASREIHPDLLRAGPHSDRARHEHTQEFGSSLRIYGLQSG